MTATDNVLSTLTGNSGIHPKELRDRWDLTYEELAKLLQKDRSQIVRYLMRKKSPPAAVCAMCWLIDRWFESQGEPSLPPYATPE